MAKGKHGRKRAAADTAEYRDVFSIQDPAFAEWFGLSSQTLAGVSVTEKTTLGLTAYWRGVSIIAGTIGSLPLKTYEREPDGTKRQVDSFLDRPHPWMTQFEWIELMLTHLLCHGNAFHLKMSNNGGELIGLQPIHPHAVSVDVEELSNGAAMKKFTVTLANGDRRDYTELDILHTPAMSTDGLVGLSPISIHRQALGTNIAGDQAAARQFGNGFLLAGLVSTETGEDVTEEEGKVIKADIDTRMKGVKNAGDVLFVNRSLKFTPFAMTAEDAQFLESRAFQIEEIARILGIPPHLLAQTDKQTSWGTGVAEQNVGLARYTFMPWTTRIEQRLSLLEEPRFSEFDYAGLFQGSPREEIELLALQVEKGLLTLDEARQIRNRPPLTAPAQPEMENTNA